MNDDPDDQRYLYQKGANSSFVFAGDIEAFKEANYVKTAPEWAALFMKRLRTEMGEDTERQFSLYAIQRIANEINVVKAKQ